MELPELLNILGVMRQQRRNALGLHGGDDAAIMYLLPAKLVWIWLRITID